MERLYESRLTGADGRPLDVASIAGVAAAQGDVAVSDYGSLAVPPLRLTIDARLQRQVEIELNAARLANHAKSASAIVMDPNTGRDPGLGLRAGLRRQRLRPQSPRRIRALLRDRVISGIYEPGSVMKVFTVTAALESGAVTPMTQIKDQPRLAVQGGEVRNSGESIGLAPVRDIIARSRNVGTAEDRLPHGAPGPPEGRPDPLRHVGPRGHGGPDRRGHGRRGGRHLVRPRAVPVGARWTSPTAPSARASASRSCTSRPATPPWSTAASASSPTSSRTGTPRPCPGSACSTPRWPARSGTSSPT